MEINHNVVGWFEIPVIDMERAIQFYQNVFGYELSRNKIGHMDMAWFPWVDNTPGSAGSLVYSPEHYKPSLDSALIYFTAFSGDLSNELGRVEANGGTVMLPKTQISEDIGYFGLFIDTEGNRIAVHSRY